jgi:hypothetical protein
LVVDEENVWTVVDNLFEMRDPLTELATRIMLSHIFLWAYIQDSSITMNTRQLAIAVFSLAKTNLFGREGYMKINKIPMDLLTNKPWRY